MPEMTGTELAAAVETRRSDLPVIFMSGYSTGDDTYPLDDEQMLRKPFSDTDLTDIVRRALA